VRPSPTCILPLFLLAAALAAQTLEGIAHVALRVSDVPVSREFYRKLGFEQSFEFSDDKGINVSYMKVNDRQFIELYRRNSAEERLGLMHLCLETGALEGLRSVYIRRGLKPTEARKARAGNLLFNLFDPEGQLIEYTQYLPGSMHSEDRGKHLGADRISEHMIRVASAVKDLEALRAFYVEKLGFAVRPGAGPMRLVLPGKSGEAVELDSATAGGKPRLTFAVGDVRRAGDELRKRGIAPRASAASNVAAVDPDGAAIVFEMTRMSR
jgi:catechol 2,3-dioxygenase-like lactoylglutathione lyase family enzyme